MSAPPPAAPAALSAVLGELREIPRQAEEEARTVADLERQLREVRAELRRVQRAGGAPDEAAIAERVETATQAAVDVARGRWAEEMRRTTGGYLGALRGRVSQLQAAVEQLVPAVGALDALLEPAEHAAGPRPRVQPTVPIATTVADSPPIGRVADVGTLRNPATGDVTRPQQRILDALAAFLGLGIDAVSRGNVAVFSDQSPSSSGFRNNLSALRSAGLIEYRAGGLVALTEAGHAAAAPATALATRADLHAAWQAKLPRPQWAILSSLIADYPHPIERPALAARAEQSPTSSGFRNNLSALRTLGLLDYQPGHLVVATALLFPEGLR